MIKDFLSRKPGNEVQVLSDSAKTGLAALDELVRERNALAQEVQAQRIVVDKLTIENEGFRMANTELQNQRDFWMRTHARIESNLQQLAAVMQVMCDEFHRKPKLVNPDARQIAEKFAPEVKNVKSVG